MPAQPNPTLKRMNLPLQTRLAQLQLPQNDAAGNIFDIVWTTGARVRRYDWMNDEIYDEELVVTPEAVRMERLNSGAVAVLNTHAQYSLDDVIGVFLAGTGAIADGQGMGRIMIDPGEATQPVLTKIQNKVIRNVSVGYRVHKYEVIREDGQIPVYRAVDWEPFEISLVPVGADAGAGIRALPNSSPCIFVNQPSKETRIMPDTDINDPNTPAAPAGAPTNPEPPASPEAPADNPNPPADTPANPAPEPEGSENARAEGMRAERTRVLEIQKIARAAKLPDTFAQRLIGDGTGLEKSRKAVLDELAKRGGEGGEIRSQVTITQDEMDKCRSVVENALLNRFNPDKFKLDPAAREYRGMTMMEIGRDMLERRGVKTRGFSRVQLAGMLLGLESRGAFHGTTDFPFILANVANKTLRDAYEAAPQTFKPFCRQTTAPDFKMMARVQLGDAPSLDKVNESGEFKRGSVSEAREQYALATYGKVVAINRQVIINDDLDAFTRLPAMFGRAAADLESDTVWGILTANAAMGDGTAMFHANHGNLAGSGTAISVASLGLGRTALRQQKGLNGRFINVIPKYLVVPSAQETTAQQFVTVTNVVYTKNPDVNPFAGSLMVIAEPRLDAASALSWYLAGDPSQIDTIEYAYLEGNEGVYLESRVGFDVDGIELKARLDFAAKAIDWRGFYKNPGA